jgi:hypothetical protein
VDSEETSPSLFTHFSPVSKKQAHLFPSDRKELQKQLPIKKTENDADEAEKNDEVKHDPA